MALEVEKVVISAETIDEIRDDESPVGELPAVEQQEIAEDLVAQTEAAGGYLDEESVDVIPLMDGMVQVAVPVDAEVQSVSMESIDDGEGVVLSADVIKDDDGGLSTGDAELVAGSRWLDDGGPWVYKLFVKLDDKRIMDADFHSQRWKMTKDDDPDHIYIRYDRWAGSQVYAVPGAPDPYLERLRIQSFPYDSVEKHLHEWQRYRPASDLAMVDTCVKSSISFEFRGASMSRDFDRCESYNMWRNNSKPGSYWNQWEGRTRGNREVTYSLLWSQNNKTKRSVHDLQKVTLSWPVWALLPDFSCTSTDSSSKTCTV